MSTHRAIQISNIYDAVTAHAILLRRCINKAADIGNRKACSYWIAKAQKCDSIAMRCTLLMGRDYSARQNIKQAA